MTKAPLEKFEDRAITIFTVVFCYDYDILRSIYRTAYKALASMPTMQPVFLARGAGPTRQITHPPTWSLFSDPLARYCAQLSQILVTALDYHGRDIDHRPTSKTFRNDGGLPSQC